MTWKIIFIGITFLLIYFSYGVAQGGGPLAFFVGCVAGSIVTYLFTRAKQEAIASSFESKQKVQVTLNQQRTNITQPLTPQQIARIVESVIDQKLLMSNSTGRVLTTANDLNGTSTRELLSDSLWEMAERNKSE